MGPEHRLKIKNSNILTVLINAAEGRKKISPVQAQIGLGLLKKVLPDISQVQLSGDSDNPVETVTRIELVAAHGNKKD